MDICINNLRGLIDKHSDHPILQNLGPIINENTLKNILAINIHHIYIRTSIKFNCDTLEDVFDAISPGQNRDGVTAISLESDDSDDHIQKVRKGELPIKPRKIKTGTVLRFLYKNNTANITKYQDDENILSICHKGNGNDLIKNFYAIIQILPILEVGNPKIADIRYSITTSCQKSLEKNIMADVILTDTSLRQFVSTFENKNLPGISRSISLSIVSLDESNPYISCTVKNINKHIVFRCKTVQSLSDIEYTVVLIAKIMTIYDKNFVSLLEIYRPFLDELSVNELSDLSETNSVKISGVTNLRKEVPELFIGNYSRECPILPIMVSSSAAKDLISQGHLVIQYPYPSNKYSRYYVAPGKNYVGLKKNRLGNRDIFSHLITCYTTNHMLRPMSETYKYYHGDTNGKKYDNRNRMVKSLRLLDRNKIGPIPTIVLGNLGITGEYVRVGISQGPSSFLSAVLFAMGYDLDDQTIATVRDHLDDTFLNVVCQELDGVSLDLAKQNFTNSTEYFDGSMYYRFFEETYKINILIIELGGSNGFNLGIPKEGKYLWQDSFDRGVILFKNSGRLYHEKYTVYELITDSKNNFIFTVEDELYKALLNFKEMSIMKHRISDTDLVQIKEIKEDIISQYINYDGICTIITTSTGKIYKTFCKPLWKVVTMDKLPWAYLQNHMEYVNRIRSENNLSQIKWRTSTNSEIYLPNRISVEKYQMWLYEVFCKF